MSTRTIISAKMKGMVYAIYCHHDGYPDHIAPLLLDVYKTQDKIEELILLGDTSAIYETIEKCDPYTKRGESAEDNAPEITHNWKRRDCNDFNYQYFWDGQQWLFVYKESALTPLSTWKEDK